MTSVHLSAFEGWYCKSCDKLAYKNWKYLLLYASFDVGISNLVFVSPGIPRARRDLEREGRGEDVSDGEWAEVQLELIRQVWLLLQCR